MKKYIFGADVGGTTVKLGFFTTGGELLDTWEIPTRREHNGGYILGDIKNSIDGKLEERGVSAADVEGIGMGVPGPVASDGAVLKCANLGWGVFNVEQRLSVMTGLKVKAGNDANAAALGEMWQGGARGHTNVVMITLGTGVGCGVVVDGRIVVGNNGAAGEISHITVREDEKEICGCGKRGCLEQYVSAKGIVRVTKRYLSAHSEQDTPLREMDDFTSKEIFDLAGKGDGVALKMADETGRLLGRILAFVSCVTNPEVFVIGGGMSGAGDILISNIRRYFRQYAFHPAKETDFCLAQLGNSAGIYGAARMILG